MVNCQKDNHLIKGGVNNKNMKILNWTALVLFLLMVSSFFIFSMSNANKLKCVKGAMEASTEKVDKSVVNWCLDNF